MRTHDAGQLLRLQELGLKRRKDAWHMHGTRSAKSSPRSTSRRRSESVSRRPETERRSGAQSGAPPFRQIVSCERHTARLSRSRRVPTSDNVHGDPALEEIIGREDHLESRAGRHSEAGAKHAGVNDHGLNTARSCSEFFFLLPALVDMRVLLSGTSRKSRSPRSVKPFSTRGVHRAKPLQNLRPARLMKSDQEP